MLICSLCFKAKNESGGKNFFKVPKDQRIRRQWGEICRLDFKKKVAWICEDHFLSSEIIKCRGNSILRPNAIPFIPPVKEPGKIIEAAYKSAGLKNQFSECRGEKLPANNATNNANMPQMRNNLILNLPQDMQNTNYVNLSQMPENLMRNLPQNLANTNNVNLPQMQENFVENLPQNIHNMNNVNLPKMRESLVMEIPVNKTVFCTRPTQTNTRICGLVETSEFADDFRLNCFYCSKNFPFNKWKYFTRHLKRKHFEEEKAFETCEYMSKEHDYTPTNLPALRTLEPVIETIGISPESLLPFLGNEEESAIPINPTFLYTAEENMTAVPDDIQILKNLIMDAEKPLIEEQEHVNNGLGSVAGNQTYFYAQDEKNEFSLNVDVSDNFVDVKNELSEFGLRKVKKTTNFKNKSSKPNQMRNVSKQVPRKAVLSRFLKRTINEEAKRDEKEDCSPDYTIIKQENTPVISFEYSPSAIVDLLLESMRNYPALWQFSTEPFNDAFSKAIEELCLIMNVKWALNIDHLTMRRSVNRILRFYCYLFPNENIENIHKFTCYYDKCAEFLPASVNEIAYARCYNCYICYKSDFDLKRHLLKEQSFNLRWPYKCVECKECFKENDEYEFHKRLPHYAEVFRCEPCKKKYFRRNKYNRHITEYHPKDGEERRFKCDKCDKSYKTNGCLIAHKVFHGERKFKCHLCPKSYHENAKLQIHLKTHRKEYDFICEVCAKEFVTQSALNVHMKKHTGEKVTCTMCDLKLRKSSLRRHLRLLHTPSDGNVSQNVILRSKGKIKSYKRLIRKGGPLRKRRECLQRNYRCKVCLVDFERYKSLAEHNKEIHSDLPKWPCQLCASIFGTKINLKRHYRKKHNLHVIQVYKLVEEGENLGDVLSIRTEQLEILAENGICSTESTAEVKSEFLSDGDSVEENMQSFQIQEDIMNASDSITKEEIKLSYISDFFTDM